jgi:hypothetical protein
MIIITEYNPISWAKGDGRIGEESHKVSDFWQVPMGFWKLAGLHESAKIDKIKSVNGIMNRNIS